MQKQNATVHLLILDPSQNDAESLISLLRNAGKATRAHRITSEEDLEEALKNSNWDLLLARDIEQEFAADDALAMIRRTGQRHSVPDPYRGRKPGKNRGCYESRRPGYCAVRPQ